MRKAFSFSFHFHNFAIWKISHAFAIMCGFFISFRFLISIFHFISFTLRTRGSFRDRTACYRAKKQKQLEDILFTIIFFFARCWCHCLLPVLSSCCTFMRNRISKAINSAALHWKLHHKLCSFARFWFFVSISGRGPEIN